VVWRLLAESADSKGFDMKQINYRSVISITLVSVFLGSIGSAWAEENAEQPAA
jgi:hypothetical protein